MADEQHFSGSEGEGGEEAYDDFDGEEDYGEGEYDEEGDYGEEYEDAAEEQQQEEEAAAPSEESSEDEPPPPPPTYNPKQPPAEVHVWVEDIVPPACRPTEDTSLSPGRVTAPPTDPTSPDPYAAVRSPSDDPHGYDGDDPSLWASPGPVVVKVPNNRGATTGLHVKEALLEATGIPVERQRLFKDGGKEFRNGDALKRLRYDGKRNKYVLRMVDKAAMRFMDALRRRHVDLRDALLLRGGPPDDGYAVAWSRQFPTDAELLARLEASFEALSDKGARRVDKLDFAEVLFGAAAMDPSPVFGELLKDDALEDYFALGEGADPPGTIVWQDFVSLWSALSTRYQDQARAAHDRKAKLLSNTRGPSWQAPTEAFTPPTVGVVPPVAAVAAAPPPRRHSTVGHQPSSAPTPFTGPTAWVHGMLPVERLPRSGFGDALHRDVRAYAGAVAKYRQQLSQDSKDGWARLGLAMAMHAGGHYAQAVAQYQGALEAGVGVDDGAVHYRLAICMEEGGDLGGSSAHLEKAAALLPENAFVLQDLGAVLWAGARPWEAIQAWRDALAVDPDLVALRGQLGLALYAVAVDPPPPPPRAPRSVSEDGSRPSSPYVAPVLSRRVARMLALDNLCATLGSGWSSVDLTVHLESWGVRGDATGDMDPLYFAEFYDLLVDVRDRLAADEVAAAHLAASTAATAATTAADRIVASSSAASAAYDAMVAARAEAGVGAAAATEAVQAAEAAVEASELAERRLALGGVTEEEAAEVRAAADMARGALQAAQDRAEAAAVEAERTKTGAVSLREARLRGMTAANRVPKARKDVQAAVDGCMAATDPTLAQHYARGVERVAADLEKALGGL